MSASEGVRSGMKTQILRLGGVASVAAAPLLVSCDQGATYEDLCEGNPGTLCTVAGTPGALGFEGDGGPAWQAVFYRPTDVVADPSGGYVVLDFNNHKLRRVDGEGTISTIVGTPLPGDGADDGSDRAEPGAPGTEVALNHPVQAEFGPDGLLYLPNWHNHKVRVWDPATGNAWLLVADTELGEGNGANAGFAGDGGPAVDALLSFPNGILVEEDGGFYILDQKNERIRYVGADRIITTIAGDGQYNSYGDGGAATAAAFRFVNDPANIQPEPGGAFELDGQGGMFVVDTYNHCIRRIDIASGTISMFAGGLDADGYGIAGYTGDGGPALAATFNAPRDIELGPDGRLYVADTDNHVVRAITLDGASVETVAGTGSAAISDDGLDATSSALNRPFGIDFDADGALLIADYMNSRIARVQP